MRGAKTHVLTILTLGLLLAAGCGGPPAYTGPTTDVHCNTTKQGLLICYDFVGLPTSSTSTAQSSCGGVAPTDGACDRMGAIGGCLVVGMIMNAPVQTTTWVYSGSTEASLKQSCGSSGGTFVAP